MAENAKLSRVRPVVVFNASTRLSGMSLNAGFSLLTAWALRLDGTPVVHFVCQRGMSRCVLGTNPLHPQMKPPCKECVAQSEVFYKDAQVRNFSYQPDALLEEMLEELPLAALVTFEHYGVPLGRLVLPSVRWIQRRFHLLDDEPTRYLFQEYLLSAWQVASQFDNLLEEINPLAVLVFNGIVFPEATARWVAEQRGIRVITHEVNLQPYSAYFSSGEATFREIDIPDTFEMTPEQDAKLDKYLEQRFKGNFSMAGVRFWKDMQGLSESFLKRAAEFKQIVPVFTNVIFDTSQEHANTVFPHMFAWLEQVLDIIKTHPDTLFVLRAHPDEARPGKASCESVGDWAQRHRIADLPNVIFVDAGETFSSYELIKRSKFVMMYTSTIGLEASLLGAVVLCGGKARFNKLPTVYFPQTQDEYRQQADELLYSETISPPSQFRHNARRYLYYELYRSALSFADFLKNDGVWEGYAALKPFDWKALQVKNSPDLWAIVRGICEEQPFLLFEE